MDLGNPEHRGGVLGARGGDMPENTALPVLACRFYCLLFAGGTSAQSSFFSLLDLKAVMVAGTFFNGAGIRLELLREAVLDTWR